MTDPTGSIGPDPHSDAARTVASWPLPGNFDVHAALEMTETLKARAAKDRPTRVDGQAVDRIGTAGLQLLCVLAHDAEQLGSSFTIQNPSDTLRRALIAAGLGRELSVWEVKQ